MSAGAFGGDISGRLMETWFISERSRMRWPARLKRMSSNGGPELATDTRPLCAIPAAAFYKLDIESATQYDGPVQVSVY